MSWSLLSLVCENTVTSLNFIKYDKFHKYDKRSRSVLKGLEGGGPLSKVLDMKSKECMFNSCLHFLQFRRVRMPYLNFLSPL